MTTAHFVQAPWKEEPVDADPAHVPCNDDDEDALSLCNLSLYCDAANHSFADDDASTSSSSSSDYDDFFEFSLIVDSNPSSSHCSEDHRGIVFCGKLISHRESPPPEKNRSPLPTGRGSPKSTSRRTRSPTGRRRKCRWYLMAFGLARFPTEMALSEMRTRQSRNGKTKGSCDGGSGEIVSSGDCGDRSRSGKGLVGLLKALGLGHHRRANALVKASWGCVPRV